MPATRPPPATMQISVIHRVDSRSAEGSLSALNGAVRADCGQLCAPKPGADCIDDSLREPHYLCFA